MATTPTTNASSYGDIKGLNDCTTTSMVGLTATLTTAVWELSRMHRYWTYGGNGVVISWLSIYIYVMHLSYTYTYICIYTYMYIYI